MQIRFLSPQNIKKMGIKSARKKAEHFITPNSSALPRAPAKPRE